MGFLGFKSAKEKEDEKQKAIDEAIKKNYANLSNLSKGSQVKFGIPYFDVFDPRLQDTGIPVAVHGNITYAIEDMDMFQSINKTEGFCDEVFQTKLRATVTKFVKQVITNAPCDAQIPAIQLERRIVEIGTLVQNYVTPQVERLFAIKVRNLDITSITVDKDSRGYRELKALTADLERENILAKHHANLSNFNLNNELQQEQLKMQSSLNMDVLRRQQELQLGGQEELQAMQLENQREMMRIQREEMQRLQRLQTEQTFLGAHRVNMAASGQNNPGVTSQMSNMAQPTPQVQYMIGVNGQQVGPFDWNQLQQLVQQGQLTTQTYVWKPGMANWDLAGNVQELSPLF